MSVDISRLAAHLAPEQQRAIVKEYRRRAEHDTTAFLLCFFAGILGAHRFYLRQFGSGLLHLLLPVVAAVVVVGGLALGVSPAMLAVVAIPLLLIGLVWAIIDLFRIDDEVYQRNLKLAEDLIARAMLADTSVERQARVTLEHVEHDAAAAAAAAAAGAFAGRQAEAEAEYRATTVTQVSESAPGQAQLGGPPATTELTEDVPIAGYGPQVQETITARHEQTPTSVTDSVETIKTYEPELPAVAAPASTEPLAAAQAEPDDTMPAAPSPVAPVAPVAPPVWEAPAETAAPPTWEVPTESNEAAAATWPSPNLPAPSDAPAPPTRKLDVTDLGGDVTEAPVADVGISNTAPQRIVLPEEPAPATASGIPPAPDVAGAETHPSPYGDPSASVADDALLFLVPEAATQAAEPAPEPAPAPTWDVPTQHFAPPAAAMDNAATAPASAPVWPVPEATSAPAPEPEQAIDRTQALPLAGVAAMGAGMGAAELAEDPAAQPPPPPAPPEPTTPAPHKLRRVRVTRQIVIDGKVVEETSAEELIEPDADPEPVRARLQEELHRKAEARERELRGQG